MGIAIQEVKIELEGFITLFGPVIPILWITKEIVSQGPQIADMEC
jgi:hypothetical protein